MWLENKTYTTNNALKYICNDCHENHFCSFCVEKKEADFTYTEESI